MGVDWGELLEEVEARMEIESRGLKPRRVVCLIVRARARTYLRGSGHGIFITITHLCSGHGISTAIGNWSSRLRRLGPSS